MRLPVSQPFRHSKLGAPGKRITEDLFLLRAKHLPSDLAQQRFLFTGIVFGIVGADRGPLPVPKTLLDDTILQGMKREDAAPPTFAQDIRQISQEFLEGFQFSVDGNSKGQKHACGGMNPCASGLTRNGSQDGLDEFPGG
jgi:hypothetical protein